MLTFYSMRMVECENKESHYKGKSFSIIFCFLHSLYCSLEEDVMFHLFFFFFFFLNCKKWLSSIIHVQDLILVYWFIGSRIYIYTSKVIYCCFTEQIIE